MQLWPEMKLLASNSLQTQYSFSIVENGEAINPFHANVPFLYLLKKKPSRGYRNWRKKA